jgi:hypothetical protein
MSVFLRFSLAFIFILYPGIIFSQSTCPPDTGTNCSPWNIGTYQTTTENPGCVLTVSYRWRNCDGNYQIYIDNIQKSGNCEFLGSEGGSSSSFQEWLDLVLIEEIANLYGEYPPEECPATSTKAIFYTASCGLWVKCEYTVDPASRVCDPDWRGPVPDYYANGVRKIKYWKWQSCGITCCKKTYSICKTMHTTDNGYDINIQAVSKVKIGNCSNPDNVVTPCEDGC